VALADAHTFRPVVSVERLLRLCKNPFPQFTDSVLLPLRPPPKRVLTLYLSMGPKLVVKEGKQWLSNKGKLIVVPTPNEVAKLRSPGGQSKLLGQSASALLLRQKVEKK
jgi:hypothetical protein